MTKKIQIENFENDGKKEMDVLQEAKEGVIIIVVVVAAIVVVTFLFKEEVFWGVSLQMEEAQFADVVYR